MSGHVRSDSWGDGSGSRAAGFGLSVLAHASILALLLFMATRAVVSSPTPDLVRISLVEPAPPPRLGSPAGAPGGSTESKTAAPAAPPAPPSPATNPLPEPKPALAPAKPAPAPRRPAANAERREIAKPQPRAVRADDSAPPPEAAASAPTEAVGEVASAGPALGSPDGDRAGVDGGLPGGRVGGLGSEVVPASRAAVVPSVIRRVMPVYPESARQRGIEGQVLIEAIIGTDGHVEESIRVVHSIPELDAAAVEAFRKWQFSPGRDAGGHPLRVILQAPVRFVLR